MPKYTLSRKGADKHALYERAVQEPSFELDLAIRQYKRRHGTRPLVLREDFCGTAANACHWVNSHPRARAIGLDLDASTLAWGRKHNVTPLGEAADRVDIRRQDVRTTTTPRADVIQAFNFSSYLFFPVAELIAYFRCVRRSLTPGGIFMVDGYGGWDSQQQLSERRTIKSPAGTFGYVWEQADFNPIDNRALCYIHFEFKGGKKMKRAFTYDWRVYSPAEVRDALSVAGFRNIDVLWDVEESEAVSNYRKATRAENCPGWLVYVVAER